MPYFCYPNRGGCELFVCTPFGAEAGTREWIDSKG